MSPKTLANISVSPEFHEFIPAAMMRLKYIFPDIAIETTENGVKLTGTVEIDELRLEREVAYHIYREKIFQQTLPLRRDLYQMLAM
jgi:hypothetical protein